MTDGKKKTDKSALDPTTTPFYAHWGMYVDKTGIGGSKNNPVDLAKFIDLRQTFYAGAIAVLAILEKRDTDLTNVDDVIGELVQFSKSRGEVPGEASK